MFNLGLLKNTRLGIIIPILALCFIGGITVFSTTYSKENGISSFFINHLAFYLVGIVIFVVLSIFNISKLKLKVIITILILFTLLSLIAVIFLGTEVYGAQRWIDFGPFSFQPSEFAKIVIIITTSFGLAVRSKVYNEQIFNIYKQSDNLISLKKLITSEAFIKVAISSVFYLMCLILILKQKSLGNSILISLIFFSIVFLNLKIRTISFLLIVPLLVGLLIGFNIPNLQNLNILLGIESSINVTFLLLTVLLTIYLSKKFKLNLLLLLILLTAGILVKPTLEFGYNYVLEPYQRQRIESFLGNDNTSNLFLNEDYNRQMSIIAVGSGRVFGKGLLNGNIVNSRLLPFAYTDFAFAGFAEQFGFIGSILIMSLFLILILNIYKIYLKTEDQFLKLICIGVISLIFFNTAQHIAMNLGITPITGVPLPLISYGGSAILSTFIGLGLINSIDLHDNDDLAVQNLKQDFGF